MAEHDAEKMTIKDRNLFARFGVESSKISKTRAHFRLFEPRNGVLSVQTIDDLDHSRIKEIGECVAKKSDKSLYGWAQITRELIEEIKLTLCIDNNPNHGHANIRGWPEEKNIRQDKQKLLANKCKLVYI